MTENNIVFITYAESESGLNCVYRLAESIRTFAGRFKSAAILLFVEDQSKLLDNVSSDKLKHFDIDLHTYTIPESAKWFYLSGKLFANLTAEKLVKNKYSLMAYLDNDTIIIDEPIDFDLENNIAIKYVPVTHNRTGVLYDSELNQVWSRIYKLLDIKDEQLIPMTSPADGDKIKTYFHAGILVLRPERGIIRKWADDYKILYEDEILIQMCRDNTDYRVFIHQMAMVGILNILSDDELTELPESYNYNIFFEKRWGGSKIWDSIENCITVRCIIADEYLPHDWHLVLKGDKEKIDWIKTRY